MATSIAGTRNIAPGDCLPSLLSILPIPWLGAVLSVMTFSCSLAGISYSSSSDSYLLAGSGKNEEFQLLLQPYKADERTNKTFLKPAHTQSDHFLTAFLKQESQSHAYIHAILKPECTMMFLHNKDSQRPRNQG